MRGGARKTFFTTFNPLCLMFRAVLRMRHLVSRRRRASGDLFTADEEEERVEAGPSGDPGDAPNSSSSSDLVNVIVFSFSSIFPIMCIEVDFLVIKKNSKIFRLK
jgi:hypothetical protein